MIHFTSQANTTSHDSQQAHCDPVYHILSLKIPDTTLWKWVVLQKKKQKGIKVFYSHKLAGSTEIEVTLGYGTRAWGNLVTGGEKTKTKCSDS